MKTILLIAHSSAASGGGEDDFLRLLKYLHGRYTIYCISPDGPRAKEFASYSDKFLIIPSKVFPAYKFDLKGYLFFGVRSIQKLFKIIPFIIKNKSIDLCFVNSSVNFVEALTIHLFNIPYVISIKEKINPVWMRRIIHKLISKTSACVVVISKFLYDDYSEKDKSNVRIIHSSIEEEYYQECYDQIEEEGKDKNFVVLNIGSFYDLKNQLCLVKAVNSIKNSNGILVKFIGKNVDKKYFELLKGEIDNSPNKDSFEIVGELDKRSLIREMKNSHCVAITSKEEGQSLVLLEAMFLNRAVISTEVGVVPEVIKDHENGLLFEVDDCQRLSELIVELKNDKELYSRIVRSSKESYYESFSLERSLKQHEQIFLESMRNG